MSISTGSAGVLRIESHSHLGKRFLIKKKKQRPGENPFFDSLKPSELAIRNRNNYILPLQHPRQGINLHSTPTGDREEFQE